MKNIDILTENNDFQYFETLRRNRIKRQKNNEFFVEGVLPINRLAQSSFNVKSFLITKDRKLSGWANDILNNVEYEELYTLPPELTQKISLKEKPSELIAIVKMRNEDLTRTVIKPQSLFLVYDRPSNPGNFGSLLRSSDAFDVNGIIVSGHSIDIYDPRVISASRGSIFDIPTYKTESPMQTKAWAESARDEQPDLQILGTDENGKKNLHEIDFSRPTVILLGNETKGLSSSFIEMADELIKIPMNGHVSSLNAACAGSIVLYETFKQKNLQN